MLWWQWVLGGLMLLAAELSFVVADFYLVFIGLGAIGTGVCLVVGFALPPWSQWVLFAVLAIVGLVFFRAKVYRYLKRPEAAVSLRLIGETFILNEPCEAYATVTIEFRGSNWALRHVNSAALEAGTLVRVIGLDGLTLLVEKIDAPGPGRSVN